MRLRVGLMVSDFHRFNVDDFHQETLFDVINRIFDSDFRLTWEEQKFCSVIRLAGIVFQFSVPSLVPLVALTDP